MTTLKSYVDERLKEKFCQRSFSNMYIRFRNSNTYIAKSLVSLFIIKTSLFICFKSGGIIKVFEFV